MAAQLLTAEQAGELLNVPHTWLLREARRDAVPHVRLGHYVRFDADELLAWVRNRRRGPSYLDQTKSGPGAAATAQGLTPKG